MKIVFLLSNLLCLLVFVQSYGGNRHNPLEKLLKAQSHAQRSRRASVPNHVNREGHLRPSSVYVGPQDGFRDLDKISALPGQPAGVNFDQYSGYVTVSPNHGRALFYYLAESPNNSLTKPLVLWLNGGPGCSSFGNGAMMELGPFRVNSDGATLSLNKYAWNNAANMLFLESPAGVGFSYSNTTSDYVTGDGQTAEDSYTFLVNWLERFSEYKTRDFYIVGESYAGHYVPQLAELILLMNKYNKRTNINLKGIAIGNAYVDYETEYTGMYDFWWSHALISDEIHDGIISNCNFTEGGNSTEACDDYTDQAQAAFSNIYTYNIYAPLCSSSWNSTPSISGFDPCTGNYIDTYLNTPSVQMSLHAKPVKWESCNDFINENWKDSPFTVLPTIQGLMDSGVSVWMYSGDIDGIVPVTVTKYSINKLWTSIKTPWYPWYYQGEVGGYVVGYQNLAFVTVRGAGHFVPSYQPGRALAAFSSFLAGKLP